MDYIKKGYGRNYWALVFEGAMFTGGIVALSTGGVIALFINVMTGSNTLIGLAVTLQALGLSVGHLLGAPYVNMIRRLPQYLFKVMLVQRSIPLIMAIPLFLSIGGYPVVYVFLTLFALFWTFDGIITLGWGELCARALKPDLRGHMMGMLTTMGCIFSLLVGLVVTWLLATPILDEYNRFAYIFVMGSAILMMTVLGIRLVNDPSPIKIPEKLDVKKYYKQIPSIIRNSKAMQHILVARIPSYIGFAALSFIIVFGVNTLDLSTVQGSWLVYAGIIGGIISGIVLGEASRRYGNKVNIILCNIFVIIVLTMSLLLVNIPGLGYIWLFATCILASIAGSNWFGYFNYFLDIATVKERSVYQLVGQLIGIPFSFAGILMGIVVDMYGYVVMFIISGMFAFISIIFSLRLLSKGKMEELQIVNEIDREIDNN